MANAQASEALFSTSIPVWAFLCLDYKTKIQRCYIFLGTDEMESILFRSMVSDEA
jgi:hypothetical protein